MYLPCAEMAGLMKVVGKLSNIEPQKTVPLQEAFAVEIDEDCNEIQLTKNANNLEVKLGRERIDELFTFDDALRRSLIGAGESLTADFGFRESIQGGSLETVILRIRALEQALNQHQTQLSFLLSSFSNQLYPQTPPRQFLRPTSPDVTTAKAPYVRLPVKPAFSLPKRPSKSKITSSNRLLQLLLSSQRAPPLKCTHFQSPSHTLDKLDLRDTASKTNRTHTRGFSSGSKERAKTPHKKTQKKEKKQ